MKFIFIKFVITNLETFFIVQEHEPIMLSILFILITGVSAVEHKKVKLSEVSTLVLREGEMTTGRRSAPIPQLNCVGHLCHIKPQEIVCHNQGTDGNDVVWKC